jgi:hypothetical protein
MLRYETAYYGRNLEVPAKRFKINNFYLATLCGGPASILPPIDPPNTKLESAVVYHEKRSFSWFDLYQNCKRALLCWTSLFRPKNCRESAATPPEVKNEICDLRQFLLHILPSTN